MEANGSVRRQILSTVCGASIIIISWMNSFSKTQFIYHNFLGNLMTVSFGSACSWSSANFLAFQEADTLLPSGPLTLKESTFVMSIYFAGAIVGNLVFPHVVKKCGTKTALSAIGYSQIVSAHVFYKLNKNVFNVRDQVLSILASWAGIGNSIECHMVRPELK